MSLTKSQKKQKEKQIKYWKDRETEALKHYIAEEAVYQKHISDIYDYMMDQVQKEINGFYAKYAKAEKITLAEARKRVSKLDMEEYERKAKKYVKNKTFTAEANEEMRLYNATMKINRLEMLKAQIGLELVDGFDELQKYYDEILTDRTLAEFERQAGILGHSIQNNAESARAIVNASFHNARFSDRIWMYQDMMRSELDKLLRQGLIQGKNPRQLARHLTKLFGVSKYNAERLMRTEMARVQIETQKQSLEANGYDEYQFHALGTACGICKDLDGRHFKIKDMEIAVNAPPCHPNCRCSISAYFTDDEFEEWLEEDSGLESDTGDKIYEGLTGISKQKKYFKIGLEKISNKDARILLEQSLERATIYRSSGRRSKYSPEENAIYLAKNATPDTLAHELFHEIDATYGLTQNGLLKNTVHSDYRRLQNLATGYGKSLEEMLYLKYPEAFEQGRHAKKLKKEYRGISDVLNGASGGHIRLGYRHKDEYWKIKKNLEREAWAQCGRMLYQNDESIALMKELFPDTTAEVERILKEMIK